MRAVVHCTGLFGDTHGEEEAKDFLDALAEGEIPGPNPFPNLVRKVLNDHECAEVGQIWPTPGRVNDGMGRHMDTAEFEALAGKKRRQSFPAYESVAIRLQARPSPEAVGIEKTRAEAYAARGAGFGAHRVPFRILGLRLVERTTVVTDVSGPL